MKNSNQSGFSLISVLIGSAILGMVIIGFTTFFHDILKTDNYMRFRMQTENTQQEIRDALSNDQACLNTFAGLVLNVNSSHTITSIKDQATNVIFQTDKIYGDRATKLVQMTLKNIQNITATTGSAVLEIQYDSPTEVNGPKQLLRNLAVSTHRNGAGVIDGCSARSTTASMNCRSVQGPWITTGSDALCAGDEFVVSGGGECRDPLDMGVEVYGYLHSSHPLPGLTGWHADCFGKDGAARGDPTTVRASAVCCKK